MTMGKAPHRVVLLTQSTALGGVERMLETLITGLDKENFEAFLVCSEEAELDTFVSNAQAHVRRVIRTPLISVARTSVGPKIDKVVRLAALLRLLHADVAHIHDTGPVGARYVAASCILARVPVIIVTPHTVPPPETSRRARYLTQLFDTLQDWVVVPSHEARSLQAQRLGRRTGKLKVIYNGVDTTLFNPTRHAAACFGPVNDIKVVGTIARLERSKGVEIFLHAAKLIHDAMPQTRFLIVGDGPERTDHERLAHALGLESVVHFTGFKGDVAPYLAGMDVFVFASELTESFGLVVAEAMAIAKPVVASAVGGIPEIVRDGSTGRLVPASDVPSLAAAVMAYLRDPELANRHGQAGLARVQQCFSSAQMVSEYEQLYLAALNRAPGVSPDRMRVVDEDCR